MECPTILWPYDGCNMVPCLQTSPSGCFSYILMIPKEVVDLRVPLDDFCHAVVFVCLKKRPCRPSKNQFFNLMSPGACGQRYRCITSTRQDLATGAGVCCRSPWGNCLKICRKTTTCAICHRKKWKKHEQPMVVVFTAKM